MKKNSASCLRKRARKDSTPYLMLAPGSLLMIVLVFYPILRTFIYSLQRMKLTEPDSNMFVGLYNYAVILKDPDFWYALVNSAVILVFVVALTAVVGMLIALLLNIDTKVKGVLMAVAIIPWAMPPIVNGVMWRWIFHPSFGLLNRILINLNLIEAPVQWLSERWSIMLIVSLTVAWRCIPFCAIVIVSAMQSIPVHLYESACIDGSSKFQEFWRITFPLLLPSLGIVLTNTSITAINVFDEIVSLTGYGDISKTLMLQAYLKTFGFLDYGMGSALTYVIMIIAGILGLIYIRNVYRKVEYI